MKTLLVLAMLCCAGCSNVSDLERRVASLEKRISEQAETIQTLEMENNGLVVSVTAIGNMAKQNQTAIDYLKEDKADKR